MKQAKTMLSVMAICGVMATAFAFKTQKMNLKKIYTGAVNQNGGSACQNELIAYTLCPLGGTSEIRASIAPKAADCPVTYICETFD